MYAPLNDICTTEFFALRNPGDITGDDYHRAIPHGRPLFALMHRENRLSHDLGPNDTMRWYLFLIAKRHIVKPCADGTDHDGGEFQVGALSYASLSYYSHETSTA